MSILNPRQRQELEPVTSSDPLMNSQPHCFTESAPHPRSVILQKHDHYHQPHHWQQHDTSKLVMVSTSTAPGGMGKRSFILPPHPLTRELGTSSTKIQSSASLQAIPDKCKIDGGMLPYRELSYDQILERILAFLRVNSIDFRISTASPGPQQEQQQQQLERQIDCRWYKGSLQFFILLWESAMAGIIVELCRRQGCCILLQKVKKTLLRLLQRNCTDPNEMAIVDVSLPQCMASWVQQYPIPQNSEDHSFLSDVSICGKLLSSQQRDQNQLGIESLWHLTKPSHGGYHILVARMLLLSHEDDAQRLRLGILRQLGSMAKGEGCDDPIHTDDNSSNELALQILANSLESISSTSEKYPVDFSTPFWRQVKRILRMDLSRFAIHPSEVALVARCIRLLIKITPTARDLDADMIDDVMSANKFGEKFNLSLKNETEKLLEELDKQT